MKTLLLIILLSIFITVAVAQNSGKPPKLLKLKGDPSCVYKPKFSAARRNQFYPFSIADTIKLISFRYHRREYPLKKDTLFADSLIEIKTLAQTEIDNLTDLLYNNFDKQHPNYRSLTQCFTPRNAILFIDKLGQLKEYILICFHCDNFQASSNKVTLGDACTKKIEKLWQFFIASHVAFGTDTAIEFYPGEETDEGIVPIPATHP